MYNVVRFADLLKMKHPRYKDGNDNEEDDDASFFSSSIILLSMRQCQNHCTKLPDIMPANTFPAALDD